MNPAHWGLSLRFPALSGSPALPSPCLPARGGGGRGRHHLLQVSHGSHGSNSMEASHTTVNVGGGLERAQCAVVHRPPEVDRGRGQTVQSGCCRLPRPRAGCSWGQGESDGVSASAQGEGEGVLSPFQMPPLWDGGGIIAGELRVDPNCQRLPSVPSGPSTAPPPVRRRVVCRSQMASTRQHNKSLVSGTTSAFRLRSDKRLVELDLQRTQCQADTTPLSYSSQALQVL